MQSRTLNGRSSIYPEQQKKQVRLSETPHVAVDGEPYFPLLTAGLPSLSVGNNMGELYWKLRIFSEPSEFGLEYPHSCFSGQNRVPKGLILILSTVRQCQQFH